MSRTLRRSSALLAAMILALTASVLVVAPAEAAYKWTTVKKNARHVKAQACRTPIYTKHGVRLKMIRYRVSAVGARNGGSVRLRGLSDRYDTYTSAWVTTRKGKVSGVRVMNFLSGERVKLRMRVKDGKGRTKWSKARSMGSLPYC